MTGAVLEVRNLDVSYNHHRAVHGASLDLEPGRVLALIGESGSGKTSLVLSIARLLPPSATVSGRIRLQGSDLLSMTREDFRRIRGSRIGFVPQDAMAALNPVMPVGRQVAEVFQTHERISRPKGHRRAVDALDRVQIAEPEAVAHLYPHQLSGGMRQRVMFAMAIALVPPVILADEPTTALDVSTQAEVVTLATHLCRELGSAMLWITHDMGVVAEVADAVAVMYAGRIVEYGAAEAIFDAPRHPYTHALLATLHDLRQGDRQRPLFQISGQPPSSRADIPGCPFHPRCPRVRDVCREVDPVLEPFGGTIAACHNPVPLERSQEPVAP
jgi:oligopeptide/dipeptide ABC transporter ATP-binding protein